MKNSMWMKVHDVQWGTLLQGSLRAQQKISVSRWMLQQLAWGEQDMQGEVQLSLQMGTDEAVFTAVVHDETSPALRTHMGWHMLGRLQLGRQAECCLHRRLQIPRVCI